MSKTAFGITAAITAAVLTASAILYSLAASEITKSAYYSTIEKIRSSYNWSIVCLSMAWGTWLALVVTIIFALVSGIFSIENPNKATSDQADQFDTKLKTVAKIRGGNSTHIIIIIVMALLIVVNTLFAIFGVIAWLDLYHITTKDSFLEYSQAYLLAAWICAFVCWTFFILAMVSYIFVWKKVKGYLTAIEQEGAVPTSTAGNTESISTCNGGGGCDGVRAYAISSNNQGGKQMNSNSENQSLLFSGNVNNYGTQSADQTAVAVPADKSMRRQSASRSGSNNANLIKLQQ